MAAITKIICDIEGCNNKAEKHIQSDLSVVFTTEQTEGTSTKPYLSLARIDLCDECMYEIVNEHKIPHAAGAQGHNTYTL